MFSDPEFDDDFFLDESHADPHSEEEDDYEQRFRAACREIKDIRKVFDKNEVDEFFTKYHDVIFQRSIKTTANLLHTLVDMVTHNGVKSKHIEFLVRRAVEDFPDLLTQANEEAYNPIFMAIKASHDELVDYMVTTCASMNGETLHRQSLNNALSMKMNHGKTCLHLAIEKQLSPRTIKTLIQHANGEALAVQDGDGKTPMHHAALFKRCTDNGVELIQLFLERDLQIMRSEHKPSKTFLDATDNSGASVYLQLQTNRTFVINAYNEWLAKKMSLEDASKKNQKHIPKVRAEASLYGENTPQIGPRQPRSFASANIKKIYGRDYEDNIFDSLEKERALERNNELKQLAIFTMSAEIKERSTESRNANQDSPTMLNRYAGSERLQIDRIAPGIPSNTSIKRRGTEQFETAQSIEKEGLASRSTQKKPTSSEYMPVLIKNSNDILLSLKVHYMRTRSTEVAISFLYGAKIKNIQMSFDYDNLPRKLLWNEFVERFDSSNGDRLAFDNVLQYVTLPRVSVEEKGQRERETEERYEIRQIGALGRKDAKYFLDWLFDKGVRHIISLSVEDSGRFGEKVHSDQIIQESLERLIVEHLDWQKIDLDPETILRVGCKTVQQDGSYTIYENGQTSTQTGSLHLRQLSLRWSGSNAVLRAWSEPDGLALLPQLQKIKLVKPSPGKDYDSPQWIDRIVNNFRKRLDFNRKTIRDRLFTASDAEDKSANMTYGSVEVVVVDLEKEERNILKSGTALLLTTPSTSRGASPYRWSDNTASIAAKPAPVVMLSDAKEHARDNSTISDWKKWLKDFKSFRQQILPEAVDPENEQRVRVTVIDTGIDGSHPYILSRRWKSKDKNAAQPLFCDFAQSNPSCDKHDPIDEDGHGTFIAGIMLQIAPDIELSIARIGVTRKSIRNDAHIGEKISLAINHAISIWETDIISMSFGSEEISYNIRNAIDRALKHNVILLAAAGNSGNHTSIPYPAKEDRVFKIFAADTSGFAAKFSPPVDDSGLHNSYFILGSGVVSAWPQGLQEQAKADGLDVFCHSPKHEIGHSKDDCDVRAIMSGTSFATPIVAALVAILYQFYNTNKWEITLREDSLGSFKSPQAIRAILFKMSRWSQQAPYNFLVPARGRDNYFWFQSRGQTGRNNENQTHIEFFSKRLSNILYSADI